MAIGAGITIAAGLSWALISFGNGTAYELRSPEADADREDAIFVQGDDATALRDEWDALELAFPEEPTDKLLARLVDPYRG